ncbi:sulfite exporter TauE/SafE family protein [Allofournierella sp.]|uniref:sulfite exporter TauE/SafE family protein n=1 Tax=Allofournierella sp. TaxID=1940256 RepID=UPI003AB6ED80
MSVLTTLPLPTMVFLCLLVGLAGFVDAAAGGGGLIALPAYMATGIPMHYVYGCNKLSSAIGTTFSTARFFKNGALELKVGLLAAAASFLGSGIASQVVLFLPDRALKIILLILLPVAAVVILARRSLPEADRSGELAPCKKWALALAIGFFIGGYDGLIGPGTGTFAILAFSALMGYDLRSASGNAKLLNLASNYASVITVVLAGKVLYAVALPAAVFGVLGHLLGSGFALKKGARFIRPMMLCVLCLLLGNLLWETFAGV